MTSKNVHISFILVSIILVSFTGINPSPTSAKNNLMETPTPLVCDGSLYQVISGQLNKLNYATGIYSPIGDYSGFDRINAMGYNVEDNFLYAQARQNTVDVNGESVGFKDIIKIDANGDVFKHITPNSWTPSSVIGDVVNGELWIASNSGIYKTDLATGDVEEQPLSESTNVVDFGYIGGNLYGAGIDGFVRIDATVNPAIVTKISVPGLPTGGFGAAYVLETNRLFVTSNSGGMYEILSYDSSSPSAVYYGPSENTRSNDGASCPTASPEPPDPTPTPPPAAAECGPTNVDTDGDSLLDSIDIDNDNDGILDINEGAMFEDTDGDSVPNMCDLDSDNDGISDLVESGAAAINISADSNNDGHVSTLETAIINGGTADRDVDGLMDIFDADENDVNAAPSAGTNPVNSDGDSLRDFLDLDSDNDGIPDSIEAQQTVSYSATFPTDNNVTDDDSDNDGIIGIYDDQNGVFGGSFNEPQNTDGDNYPDYLDDDSDNDSKSDFEEHGLIIESGGPANPTYADPNGRIDDPQTMLLNEAGDNTEVAYRELWIPPTTNPEDKDGDGVPDTVDIDDDNDGIIDREENIDIEIVALNFDQKTGRANGLSSRNHLGTSATNNCPAGQIDLALYGGSLSNGMIGASSVHSISNGICVQMIPAGDWAAMSIEDFQTFDVLWIGNDDCSGIGGAAAFNQAVSSRPTWEAAIDPGNVMIAGGDYDWHVFRNGGGAAREITAAMIKESADGTKPGLVLQAGCYSIFGSPWYQNLGGTFEGLFHGGVSSANPGPSDVTSHEFNTSYGWTSASYAFGQSCHGGIYIAPGSPVEQYNLQVLFYYPGGVVPCFMMSDERFPPFFPTRDTDNDSIPDACDLDSDNDGISDLVESGASAFQIAADINRDGTVSPIEAEIATGRTADADGDGLMDIFDRDITDTNYLTSIGTIPANNDRDIFPNYVDLDSDSDGIPDVIEGKPTKDFGSLYGNDGDVRNDDRDADGVIAVFDRDDLTDARFGGTFPAPEDTDSDNTPDYLDLDSDNDFILDEWESGLTLNGADIFSDGLDDRVNPTDNYRDNNGIVDIPSRDLADEDNNAETIGDVDYREFNPDFDRGDAPASYGQALNSIASSVDIWIGTANQRPDQDENPLVLGTNALADDLTNTGSLDDEEGVTWNGSEDPSYDTGFVFYPQSPPGMGTISGAYSFNVDVYNERFDQGFLNVWIDFDGNGQFDFYELIQNRVVNNVFGEDAITLSNQPFVVPDTAACGRTYARFRFSHESFGSPTEYGGWGETEDHAITIDCRTDLEVSMEFEPNAPGVNDIALDPSSRTYSGEWELSHDITVRTIIKNNGPQSARQMTATIQLPIDMDDVAYSSIGSWLCDVDEDTMIAECTSLGMPVGASEQIINFTGRIPGTFSPDAVTGFAEIDHIGGDMTPDNNHVDYNINVLKEWYGTENIAPFIHTQFSDVLSFSSGSTNNRDLQVGERVANPIQVPLLYGAGIDPIDDPILRTRWCNNDPSYTGCNESTDFIIGTIAVQSHTTESVRELGRSSSGTFETTPSLANLLTSSVTTFVSRDGSNNPQARYAEAPYADCQEWINIFGGQCMAKQAELNSLALSAADRANYDWGEAGLTPIVFQTSGGRPIDCANSNGDCIYVENARPNIFLVEGFVSYQVIFHDPIEQRLGTDTVWTDRDHEISFYIQLIAPFVEPNN